MRIGIATDHGGFELKQMLMAHLREIGHDVVDVGAHSVNPGDDYREFVIPLGPVNFLLIESLQRLHHYGQEFTVECPTGSGVYMTLWDVAAELSRRLARIFLKTPEGNRPVNGANWIYADDLHWRDSCSMN